MLFFLSSSAFPYQGAINPKILRETREYCTRLFYKLIICTNTRNCVMQQLLLHMHKAIGLDLGDSGNGKARDITYSMRKEITAAGIIPLNRNESVPNV